MVAGVGGELDTIRDNARIRHELLRISLLASGTTSRTAASAMPSRPATTSGRRLEAAAPGERIRITGAWIGWQLPGNREITRISSAPV
jgi:hypothetical protein